MGWHLSPWYSMWYWSADTLFWQLSIILYWPQHGFTISGHRLPTLFRKSEISQWLPHGGDIWSLTHDYQNISYELNNQIFLAVGFRSLVQSAWVELSWKSTWTKYLFTPVLVFIILFVSISTFFSFLLCFVPFLWSFSLFTSTSSSWFLSFAITKNNIGHRGQLHMVNFNLR